MKEISKEIEAKKLVDDYNKCEYYLDNLKNGNTECLVDAINFSNNKYVEFCIKDSEVALLNTNPIPTSLDSVSQTIQNLRALEKMIDEIIIKKSNN